jgi:DNA sulfur modification protein DndE
MLPNRMQLTKTVEEQLKRLKSNTDITPNISARIAFFRSVESGFTYTKSDEKKLDGSLVLDKITWLGETQLITEQVLKLKYPNLEGKALQSAWAAHVEDGIATLRNHKNLLDISTPL